MSGTMESVDEVSSSDHQVLGEEPVMYVQRPTSEKSQDISHIFACTFRDLFCKDAVSQDTVKYLAQSRSGHSSYHDHYAEILHKIQAKWERDMELIEKLESHLLNAREVARQLEQEKTYSAAEEYPGYENLGLPPVPSQLGSCLDADLLRSLNLVVPQDFITDYVYQKSEIKSEGTSTPRYATPTTSSQQRTRKVPPEDNYYPDVVQTAPPERFFRETNDTDILRVSHTSGYSSLGRDPNRKIHGVKENVKIRGRKKVWKDAMKPQQRQIERTDLSRIEERADFLKNPRFVSPGLSTKTTTSKGHDSLDIRKIEVSERNHSAVESEIFATTPNPVIFTDYEPGKVYEATLRLKNVTSASRQLRVLPPSTEFFSIGLGQFPSENGVVAPGMSCQYTVYFNPDSLADYNDVLKLITQESVPILLYLQARRIQPRLSLPECFDCGYSLVNSTKVLEFMCTNSGGDGRFCILPKSQWPTHEWKWKLDSPGHLELGPFRFEPAMCRILAGESVLFKIQFAPTSVKTYNEEIVFVCDNCQVKSFELKGVGELAGIEFLSVDGGLSEHSLGESKDSSCQHFVRFGNRHPDTVEERKLKIRNTTAVALTYYWMISRPRLGHESDSPLKPGSCDDSENYGDISPFSISPSCGKLQANVISSFDVIFKPRKLGVFHDVLTLVLRDIPNDDSVASKDMPTLSFEVKGRSKAFDVMIRPLALVVPGTCLISTTLQYTIEMINNNDANVEYSWPVFDSDSFIASFNPEKGVLSPFQKLKVDVLVTGKVPGRVKEVICCRMFHTSEAVSIFLDITFAGPNVEVYPKVTDFGLVRYGQHQTREVMIVNHTAIPAAWSVSKKEDKSQVDHLPMLSTDVTSGVLEPMGQQLINVKIHGTTANVLSRFFEINVQNGQSKYLEVRADVQRPAACFLSSTLKIKECYVDIPVIQTVQLFNQTLLVTDFKILQIVGRDADTTQVSFYPDTGTLKPRQCLDMEVHFVGKEEGEIKDLIAVFELEGAKHFVPLSISVDIKGLSVEYIIPNDESDVDVSSSAEEPLLTLNFGEFVSIGSNPKTYLIIKNMTAIPTYFNVDAEYFRAHVSKEKSVAVGGNSLGKGSHSKRPMLSRAGDIDNERNSILSKTQEVLSKSYLSDGNGACFVPVPSEGQLSPFGEQVLEITAFSDMWGNYEDILLCQVGCLEVKHIPIRMNVVGSPLNLQISKEQPSVIRFGTHVSGADVIRRKLRVNNISPYDIRTHWESYVLDFNDDQLIDLNVRIGNPFPLLDENGCEVEDFHDFSQLINIDLTEHQGKLSERPFDVQPKQLIIPGRGHAVIEALFYPTQGMRSPVDFIGYALGYMCLAKKDKTVEGKCRRDDGVNMLPFSVNMTGTVKPAKVYIECDEDKGFTFNVLASSLLKHCGDELYQVKESHVTDHRMVLTNSTGAKLTFSVLVDEPFQVALPEQYRGSVKELKRSVKNCSLEAAENTEFRVSFHLSSQLLAELVDSFKDKTDEDTRPASRELKRNMKLQFSNGTAQIHELTARIYWPNAQITPRDIDFGICLVGQRQERQIKITNYGESRYCWTAEHDPSYPEASQGAFQISPSRGCLGPARGSNEDKRLLIVTFIARHNVQYEGKMIIKGVLGESTLTLLLRGTGSYDQASEKPINVVA